ncbi:hypothetical protein L9W73_17000 [Vibrio aestuarianus]|uniref:Uncharacterized protein n=1 Tax=Vibrio aestuarianus TaxID=28171 RepID=A0A9X4J1W2_9VIBR|nr:hypothetical protein [Vibrio aestuarianus]MDE1312641.1 hypothetical protein [Vibrio aestuarianus]MDE1358982.1 hypothetical protein [Vibrio aestuarianus]NGZ94318.1 hypothetical protein [Vibrio aestuarianus subsp. cardii]
MSFNFDELLNQGKDAADLVTQNKREINEVLTNLKESISRFLELDIKFMEQTQYEDDKPSVYRVATMFEPRKKTGYSYILIENEETGVSKTLMTIKRSSEGYPIKVVHDKNHYSADNQSEFAQAVGSVVSNSQTHLMFRGFKRSVEEKRQQTLDADKS